MKRQIATVGLGALLVAMASSVSCEDALSQNECHRQMVDRFGCCPACDAECRSAITRECAEVHDQPLVPADDTASSGTSGGGGDEPEPE
jgi:hypothetical protein